MSDAKVHVRLVRVLDLAEGHVAAASGLVRLGAHIYVVADDELHLGVFALGDLTPGRRLRLFPGELPEEKRERKRVKPDFEALVALPEDRLLAVPSGSKSNRYVGALVTLSSDGTVAGTARSVDFSRLLAPLAKSVGRLNIEGAVLQGDHLRLLQRGNTKGAVNAVIDVPWQNLATALEKGRALPAAEGCRITPFDLGTLANVPLSFTDGAGWGDDRLLFIAAAEATDDAYEDAPCSGSALGIIDGRPGCDLKLRSILPFDRTIKAEGLAVELRRTGEVDRLDVYVVTDDDDATRPSQLFCATLNADELSGGSSDSR